MKKRFFIYSLFFLLVVLFLSTPLAIASKVAVSYYRLIQKASDIVIIDVERIEGIQCSEKAIAKVIRSFKEKILSNVIELPFEQTCEYVSNVGIVRVSDGETVSFVVGKRYVVFLQKWQPSSTKITAPKTEYEVDNYSSRTFFEIIDTTDTRIAEIKQLLEIVSENDATSKVNSLLQLTYNDSADVRIDAVEALQDLKSKKAVNRFISLLRSDPEPIVRYKATWGLAWLHSDNIIPALMECLQTETTDLVKGQIINVLSKHKAKDAVPILLKRYETEGYNVRNAILNAASYLGDSTIVPSLIRIFQIDHGILHRRNIVRTIASFPSIASDEFSSAMLDTAQNNFIKSAVIDGWIESDRTQKFDQIARWTSEPCTYEGVTPKPQKQNLIFTLLRAIEKLGTPEQIVTTLKMYSNCSDPVIRKRTADILKAQLTKDITSDLRKKIEDELKVY